MVGKESIRPGPATARSHPEFPVKLKAIPPARMAGIRGVRIGLAVLSPFIAAAVLHVLWPFVQPFAWFIFYPAVFFSAWIGGVSGGIASACISTLLVWWRFVPPEFTWAKDDPYFFLPAAVFFIMAIVFSYFQGRLTEAKERAVEALEETRLTARRLQQAFEDNARLIEQASDGIFIANLDARLLEVNTAGCLMLGYSHDEIVGQLISNLLPPADIERLERAKAELQTGKSQIEEWSLRRKDGDYCAVEASAKILADGRWQIFLRDITERKLAQKRLQLVQRANSALSKCNQALVRATDEQVLLQQICNIIVQEAGYPLCWVGRAEHDEAKSVTVLAYAGHNGDYIHALNITWEDIERGHGPTGTCIRTGCAVTSADIEADQEMAPWRVLAVSHGYASSLAIPLFLNAELFGSISIYATESDAFHMEEVRLLSELADDLSYGISALRTRAERERAERELVELNTELEQRVEERTHELQEAREREFEIGHRIQETLLMDRPPTRIPGVHIATMEIPTQRIDGDFIVFMAPREGSFDVVVGDVMGKGTAAALVGAATKAHLLKALGHLSAISEPGKIPEPQDIVLMTHQQIARQLINLDTFVTLCYARIHPSVGAVDMVDCGHTGVIQLHRREGSTELLHGENLPLGVREEEIFEQRSFPLAAGDLLLFFSDGITEARNAAGDMFGTDRLQQCVRAYGGLAPTELIETIRKILVSFCGSDRMADDVTLVALRLEEAGAPTAKVEMIIKSDLCQLECIREFVRSFCAGLPLALLDDESVAKLELAVNETASNIMKHAYLGQKDREILLEAEAGSEWVAIRLHHSGRSFQPEAASLPSLEAPSESGLGLYIVSQCVDEVRYYRDGEGRNCISLTKLSTNHARDESEAPWKSQSKAEGM